MAVAAEEHGVAATQPGWNTPDPRYVRLPLAVSRGPTVSAGAGSCIVRARPGSPAGAGALSDAGSPRCPAATSSSHRPPPGS